MYNLKTLISPLGCPNITKTFVFNNNLFSGSSFNQTRGLCYILEPSPDVSFWCHLGIFCSLLILYYCSICSLSLCCSVLLCLCPKKIRSPPSVSESLLRVCLLSGLFSPLFLLDSPFGHKLHFKINGVKWRGLYFKMPFVNKQ